MSGELKGSVRLTEAVTAEVIKVLSYTEIPAAVKQRQLLCYIALAETTMARDFRASEGF